MKPLQFSVTIQAPKQKVWQALWDDQNFRQWAGLIDPGTYMVGELKQANEVQFISAENGYGVTSLVDQVTPNELLVLKHQADTQNTGTDKREKEWTGGEESYRLTEKDGTTTLVVAFDVPAKMEDYFNEAYPKALQKVKELAEN